MSTSDIRAWVWKRLPLVGGIVVLLLGVQFIFFAVEVYKKLRIVPIATPPKSIGEMIRTGTAELPEYTEAVAAKVATNRDFEVAVSYTDRGFEPGDVRIRAGEAVRFTNNSSDTLWVAPGEGADVYPRTYESCGSSDLDSCEPFAPMDFWEFTFEERGEWGVVNNLDKSKRLTVIVE